jgi:hypothetical protein
MKSRDTGESIQETFAKNKLPLRLADTDRMNGWQRLHGMLQTETNDGVSVVPSIQVYAPGCPGLVKTFPMMRNDPKNPGDLVQNKDHWLDAARYFAMSRPQSHREKKSDVWARLPKDIRKALMGSRATIGSDNVRRSA